MLSALLVPLGWSINNSFAKKALEELKTISFLFYRYLIALPILILIFFAFDSLMIPELNVLFLIVISSFLAFVSKYTICEAFKNEKISVAAPIIDSYPVITVSLAVIFLGETIFLNHILGFVLILISVYMISQEKLEIKMPSFSKGILFSIAALFFQGISYAILKIVVERLTPLNASLYIELSVFLFVLVSVLVFEKMKPSKIKKSGIPLIIAGFSMVIPSVFYMIAIKEIGVALTSIIASSTPVFNSIVAFVVLKEKLPNWKYLAILLLVLGLVVLIV
ncbi:DMT family transporter [Candidatus Micrarchaeota archaeon]|jgi:drug/metabolite transporter (DMT)-like permease|nr:DMT family transporter [Candidatus Micrarchaeota archaeon]